jgi:tetratricopeptide (TPR) repeat protein
LDDFGGSAKAYDEAFSLLGELPEAERPWRILWYQTRPYWAYYYTARYRDLADLATKTLDIMPNPVLEESYYWRALARESLGDVQGAIADLKAAIQINPHFMVGLEQLRRLTDGT